MGGSPTICLDGFKKGFSMHFLIRQIEKLNKWVFHTRWRRRMAALEKAGLKIGKNVVVEATVYIDQASPFLIEIGNNCVLAHGVRVLTHDATPYKFLGGYTRLGRVHIKDNVFIAENVTILPGVTIGPNVLIAAGALINKDIGPNSCVAGVPGRFYSKFDEMLDRHRQGIKERPIFDHLKLYHGDNRSEIERCRASVQDGDAYVKGFRGIYPYIWNYTPENETE
jgi:acetyltransferase-like isoleucine patch superfamily enzyme